MEPTTSPFPVTGEHPDASRRVPISRCDRRDPAGHRRRRRGAPKVGVDVETGVVRLQLTGACGSCAVSAATLNGGVNRILRERLSWVTG
ncbi:MAG: NifU family protein [Ilumatobacteraceae bacterium]